MVAQKAQGATGKKILKSLQFLKMPKVSPIAPLEIEGQIELRTKQNEGQSQILKKRCIFSPFLKKNLKNFRKFFKNSPKNGKFLNFLRLDFSFQNFCGCLFLKFQ